MCLSVICLLLGIIASTDGACTYPTNLQGGSFITSFGETVNFTSTEMALFPIYTFGSFRFTCDINTGSNYVSKSEVFYRFGLPFEAFLCMNITEISANKHIFYQATTQLSDAGNVRLKIFLQGKTISSVSEICDVTDYANLTTVLMIKDGSIDTEKIDCPTIVQGFYSYVYNSGSGDVCTGSSSELDTCTDTTLMTYNLTACSQVQAYAAGGQLNCLYYYTSGSDTYLSVYNRDSTVDNSATYRLACYVFSSNDSAVYATQYPNNCHEGQTSTSVNSPGARVVFNQTSSCPLPTTTPATTTPTTTTAASTTSQGSVGIVVGVIIVLMAFLLVILFAVWFFWKKKKREIEEERRRKELEDGGEDGLSDGLPDESKYDIDRLMYTPDQLLTPSQVHPKVTGRILDKDNFEAFGDDDYMDEYGWQDVVDAKDFMHARGRRDGKDEFEVGCPRDKAHKKTVKNLMKSKKKKKRKGKKEKKKRKGKPYETESDEEYEDIVDAGEEKQRRELNIYIDGAQGDDDDDDYEYTNDVKRKTRFEETDDEKLRRRRRLKKDIEDVDTVSDIMSCDMMIGDLDTDRSFENEKPVVPRLILPNLIDLDDHKPKEKKKKKRTKPPNTTRPAISLKSFRKRKVTAWLDKSQGMTEGDPLPLFYEDPKLKSLSPLQRVNRKKRPTLWTDILKKFGGDFKEFEFKHKRNMSENRWKKLLEELYTDKKYFDYVNKTSRGKKVDDDLKSQANDGLEYLYDRATFWEEQKPIPPRPMSFVAPVKPTSAKCAKGKKKKGIRRPPPTPVTQVRIDSMDVDRPMPTRETTF